MQEMITERQFNYLKGLIKSAGRGAYSQARYDLGIDRKFLEQQLSKRQAQRLIGYLVEIAKRAQKHDGSIVTSVGFEIETSYNTTMLADSDEELLRWAEKRFRDRPDQLKKIRAFAGNGKLRSLDVLGYKIKRSKCENSDPPKA